MEHQPSVSSTTPESDYNGATTGITGSMRPADDSSTRQIAHARDAIRESREVLGRVAALMQQCGVGRWR